MEDFATIFNRFSQLIMIAQLSILHVFCNLDTPLDSNFTST